MTGSHNHRSEVPNPSQNPSQGRDGLPQPYYQDEAVTIYHGDCRELMPDMKADILLTDPPYGLNYQSGRHRGERFPRSIVGDTDCSLRDRVLVWWGNSRPAVVFASPEQPAPIWSVARLVWHKPGSGMGDLSLPWKPDYEFIYVLGTGFEGSRTTSVLTYPLRVFRGNLTHPHEKPLDLLRVLIQKCPPGSILDPFMGSGTTLRAAKDLGRKAIGIEIEERYCEIAAKRMGQEVLPL